MSNKNRLSYTKGNFYSTHMNTNRSSAFPFSALVGLETKHTAPLKKGLLAVDRVRVSAAGQRQASGRRIPSPTGRLNP
jgi:hypothetical protein